MKLALITPRYGAEITHGPEHVCCRLAEQLAERHDVDVLTTCARDPDTWKNVYPEGVDRVRGVVVRRFPASGGRDADALEKLTKRLATTAHSRADELDWVRRTGSSSTALVEFLKRQQRNYDALVFFSYAAGTTVHGLCVAPERSILFPCAELSPTLRLMVAQETLAAPAAVGYCSGAERALVRAYLRRPPAAEEIVGVGVDPVPQARYPRIAPEPPPTDGPQEPAEEGGDVEAAPAHLSGRGVLFRRRHRLQGRFVLYAGRVDGDNGTEELIEYFDAYVKDGDRGSAAPERADLVLLGVKMMKLPTEPWLRSAGVLPDRDRLGALEAADVAAAPGPHDLAGEQALDGLAVGTPVIASVRNAAAVEHCRRSNGGLYYANREEFVEALRLLMTNEGLRHALGRNGRRYVQQQFRSDAVIARFERLAARVRK